MGDQTIKCAAAKCRNEEPQCFMMRLFLEFSGLYVNEARWESWKFASDKECFQRGRRLNSSWLRMQRYSSLLPELAGRLYAINIQQATLEWMPAIALHDKVLH